MSLAESQFGRLVGGHHVDEAIISLIKKWERDYLREVARQSDESFDRLSGLRSYRIATDVVPMPEDQRPVLILVNEGVTDPPVKHSRSPEFGQGFDTRWEYHIGIQVVAKGKKESASPRAIRLAWMYMLAVRSILIQQEDKDFDLLGSVDWIDESPGGLDSEDDRTTCLIRGVFHITVPDVVTWGGGPLEPEEVDIPPDPDSPIWPVIQLGKTDVTITKEGGE